MATVFSPVSKLEPEEVARGTAVTYLGQVHGMMSALKRMRERNRGAIVNVGSALPFDSRARSVSWEVFTSRHRNAMWALIALGAAAGLHQLAKRLDI